ncbi:MAG: peptidoglycan DD-metalloendopeptidase family protein [Candidatus Harrisonbacteria bacterium]|nr:peptidoglycan DD-metalloendopeptidase family protein [Candidatus Harrisonbacteria bacterium]
MNYEPRIMRKFIYWFLPALLYSSFLIHYSFANEIPADLKNAINDKARELQEVNQKIAQTQKELEATEGKGKSLQKEIKQIDYRLRQLDLSIRSSEINIDKLKLEIQSLEYDIGGVRSKIGTQRSGIAEILRTVQKKDSENTLIMLLKHKSLAASLSEIQNLADFNDRIATEIQQLEVLDEELSDKLDLTGDKKSKLELENQNLKNRKSITAEEKNDRQDLLVRTKNQEKNYQKLISDLEKQQAAIASEIEKLEAELRAKIDPSLLPIPRPGVLAMPVPGGILSQGYGATSFARLGYKGQWHNGLDFAAPIGTPVYASEKGKVLEVWNQDKYCYKAAYGKFIVIEHPNNLTTLYAHLSLQAVQKGDEVQRDQLIGYVGNTGYATGPHLHLTVYASQTFRIGSSKINCGPIMPYGGDLDPGKYL